MEEKGTTEDEMAGRVWVNSWELVMDREAWPSPSPMELESLHFVIEMKNERIHELDKRLILMETVVRGWQQLG